MSDGLLSLTGPEGRDQEAATFEDQLVAMGADLGWELVFRNIDLQLGGGGQGPARSARGLPSTAREPARLCV